MPVALEEARPPEGSTAEAAKPSEERLTAKRAAVAMAIGAGLIVLTAIACRNTELVTGRYVVHGVPPVPAFASLLVAALLRPVLLRVLPRLAPSRSQMLVIYVMVASGVIFFGSYHVRAFLPHLVALQYHERPGGTLAGGKNAEQLPAALFPKDMRVVEDFYNGARDRQVPWEAWLGPLGWWALFLLAIFLGAFCLMHLVQKQWIEHERLTFPLLNIPLAMTAPDWSAYGPRNRRRALFALGFGASALFNGINILHVVAPTVPSLGFYMTPQMYGIVLDRPWEPLLTINLFFMVEAIGIGYFVPLEVTFATWFFYLATRAFAVAGMAAGVDTPGFPFNQDQAAGGYIAIGVLLFLGLRKAFVASLQRSFLRGSKNEDVRAERLAWVGLVLCTAFALGFCHVAGFSLLLAAPFFVVLALYVLVYARIRSETGVPLGFIYPYNLPKEGLLNTIGYESALGVGGPRSLLMFSGLAWLSRHHFAFEHAAYQLDGIKLSKESRISWRTLGIALVIAFAVGLAAGLWAHLSAYYDLGANMAGGGNGSVEFRAQVAAQEYTQTAGRIANPPERDVPRLTAMGGGAAFTAMLFGLRRIWFGSPFHPLGYILGTAYGESNSYWFPLFVAWLCKACLLRVGGLRTYRMGIPFFLGLAIGHFFMGGIFWPVFSLFLSGDVSRGYHMYFGG